MKTKIKKEYKILLIISICFSTIFPFALNKLIVNNVVKIDNSIINFAKNAGSERIYDFLNNK